MTGFFGPLFWYIITIGLLAELVVRTYHESQKKPIYYVRKVLGEPVDGEG